MSSSDIDIIYDTPNKLYCVVVEFDEEVGSEVYVVINNKYGVKEHRSSVLLDALTTANFLDKKILKFFDDKAADTGEYDDILENLLSHPLNDEDIH